jgi:uncharacterized protein (DUF924 family)
LNNQVILQDLLSLWFAPETSKLWFHSTQEFDDKLRDRYEATYLQAKDGDLDDLTEKDELALALVILLDQIPLNIYRHDGRRYATADRALSIARQVIDRGGDRLMGDQQKAFLYMPFMHSENLEDQKESIRLFEQAGLKENAKFAHHHYEIVKRFGRFPHRNKDLGRSSTEEEIDWLNSEEGYRA